MAYSDLAQTESLLVLSDVHLGSDLNDHPQPANFGRRSKQVDQDLVRLIEHYRGKKPRGSRWRIVFAGDFIDFIGMAILPHEGESFDTEPSAEEREHGLGNAADHARIKLRKVEARHADVFAALGRFLADGHAISVVHGNHDVEFHWDAVQREMRELLARHAGGDRDDVFARIEFNPWFFYQEGLAYIEHGHQYDPLCASELVMTPVSPLDPRRIARGFSDVLLRYVVRPTRGLKEYGHDRMGVFDYVAFGMSLGVKGVWKLFTSFSRAVVELFRLRRAAISDAAKRLREEHERRMAAFAEQMRVDLAKLRALTALQVRPIQSSIRGILGSVLLDRIGLGFAAVTALALVAFFGVHHHTALLVLGATVLAAWFGGNVYLTRTRVPVDPDMVMRERAASLARLFPAAFVVMGHTHTPVKLPVANGAATYINVGSWSEDEADPNEAEHYRAARTHLVIHSGDASGEGGPLAEFLTWDSNDGPRQYDEQVAPAAQEKHV